MQQERPNHLLLLALTSLPGTKKRWLVSVFVTAKAVLYDTSHLPAVQVRR